MKLAMVFPGQGSQYKDMGKDFYENYTVSRECFELAGQFADISMEDLIFQENPKLNQTKYTQIAMLATELAIWSAVKKEGIRPDVTAGLSLGEYASLAVSECISLEDAFRIVAKRGKYMEEAVPTGGAMTAVMGLEAGLLEELCRKNPGIVSIANYNCPGQVVITGEEAAVKEVADAAKLQYGKKSIPLKVSGPFHSKLLEGAGSRLGEELKNIEFADIKIPYLTNVTAGYVREAKEIPTLLIRQVSSSVRWQQSVERMIEDGVDVFLELGPKKTLTGFLKKTAPEITGLNIETVEDLHQVLPLIRE